MLKRMLQHYRRQSTIKPFAPILKDRSSRRWDSEISLQTNLSLLSISNSSKQSEDDEIPVDQHSEDRDSSISRESTLSIVDESKEHKDKHVDLDPYIFNKHLNGISSTTSNLNENDRDRSVSELFDESKSTSQWQKEEYDPRSIRPPPFFQYMKQVRDSRVKAKLTQSHSARIPVRTTKAEQLKLARQKSAGEINSNLPYLRPSAMISPDKLPHRPLIRHPTASSIIPPSRSRTTSNHSYRQIESARTCKEALDSNHPLVLSSMLVKQMRQDIKNNIVPIYSKSLNSALLREQPHPPLTHQYKMKRIRHWLEQIIPNDYLEYNEYASHESTLGTKSNDKLDEESDLLFDEKRSNTIERTSAEAHRALPLFKSEIYRKMRQHNLLLTRLELDLYVL